MRVFSEIVVFFFIVLDIQAIQVTVLLPVSWTTRPNEFFTVQ
jgi:hypothetical protein